MLSELLVAPVEVLGAAVLGDGSPGCKSSAEVPFFCFVLQLCLAQLYLSLQDTDLDAVERLAGLVAVADVLESLGSILARDVEHNLLATTAQHTSQ